jgi:hypothetical protein
MTSASERMEQAFRNLRRENPLSEAGQASKPRRYARTTNAVKVNSSLWPDVFELLQRHAEERGLSHSGAVHDCLRRYFDLPEIH